MVDMHRNRKIMATLGFAIMVFIMIAMSIRQVQPAASAAMLSPLDSTSGFLPLVMRDFFFRAVRPPPQAPHPDRCPGRLLSITIHWPCLTSIPDTYLQDARGMTMVFMDRSVGVNIHEGLDCLTYPSWPDALASCRRDYYDSDWNWKTYSEQDYINGLVPATILFDPDPVRYDRSNWSFQYHAGSWEELVQDFVQVQVPAYVQSNDILSFQFSYLNIDEGSTIDGEWNPDGSYTPGFFDADPGNPNRWDISDLEALEAQYPGKTFIYWTSSLARNIGWLLCPLLHYVRIAIFRARLDVPINESFSRVLGLERFQVRDIPPVWISWIGIEEARRIVSIRVPSPSIVEPSSMFR